MKTRCRLAFFLFLILSLMSFASCNAEKTIHTVTFLSAEGETLATRECADGGRVTPPDAPEKMSETFLGWYPSEKNTPFDFSSPVRSDMTMTARYETDYEALTNRIAKEAMSANVTVETRHYRSPYSYDTSIASGTLIANSGGMYFLLTNCHNVRKSGYIAAEYTVTDCCGNRYKATLNSADEAYDLAVLYFTPDKELSTLTLATSSPDLNITVAAIGQPGGQHNTLTYGKTSAYRPLANAEGEVSAVTFDILLHTAPTDHGSSGGAVLDGELRLVGLDFAVLHDEDGNFLYTAAIPAEKIAEYLAAHPFY